MRAVTTYYSAILAFIIMVTCLSDLSGQEASKYIRKGNRIYKKNEYAGSERLYRHAEESATSPDDALFNLGNALYKQQRFGEASAEYGRSAAASEGDSVRQAEGYYNMGNALLKEQKYEQSIEAYINSLKLNPGNMQAKYNLTYAQDQLQQQDQQEQQQGDDQKDDQQEQQQGDDQKDDQQEQQQGDDQKDDQQDQQQGDDQKDGQQDQQQATLSREDAQRLLDALAAEEKAAQDKVQREKVSRGKVRVMKNW